jgi:hypothetical protein
MGSQDGVQHEPIDFGGHTDGRKHVNRTGENRLTWEMPLNVVRGQLDEPGPRFVDVEGEADKEACRWERGGLL